MLLRTQLPWLAKLHPTPLMLRRKLPMPPAKRPPLLAMQLLLKAKLRSTPLVKPQTPRLTAPRRRQPSEHRPRPDVVPMIMSMLMSMTEADDQGLS